MPQEFYDVKIKQKVSVDEKNIFKTTFTSDNGQVRYGIRGTTEDGRLLTKFVSKADWDAMPVEARKEEKKPKEEKAPKATKSASANGKSEEKSDSKPAKKSSSKKKS